MISQTFPRAIAPHIPTLADAIRPLMLGRVFYLRHSNGMVVVEVDDFTGIPRAAIQTLVDSAVADSPRVARRYELDTDQGPWTDILRAFALVVMDELNLLRTQPVTALPPRTEAQIKTAIKAKLDTF